MSVCTAHVAHVWLLRHTCCCLGICVCVCVCVDLSCLQLTFLRDPRTCSRQCEWADQCLFCVCWCLLTVAISHNSRLGWQQFPSGVGHISPRNRAKTCLEQGVSLSCLLLVDAVVPVAIVFLSTRFV